MVFKDNDKSKYTFIKYPYSEKLYLIYGNYLNYINIDSNLKYVGVYDKEKEVLFALDYDLKSALGLSWNNNVFKSLLELKNELISKLSAFIDDYIYQNKNEFYDAVTEHEEYNNIHGVETDFIYGIANYKYKTNIYEISKEDILKYLDNEEYVFDWAFDYIQKNKEYIGKMLKETDAKNDYLISIVNNKNHPLHKAREIKLTLEKSNASMVHVYIYKADLLFDFKYDKSLLMYSLSNSYLSTYNMSASDRREYEKRFGAYKDFNFNDIYKIEFRNKPLYIDKDFFEKKELSGEEYSL